MKTKSNSIQKWKIIKNINWFQIPVLNMERAISFYSNILSVEFDRIRLLNADIAVFPYDPERDAIKGALYCGLGHGPAINRTIVFLNAGPALSVVLAKVEEAGGTILKSKTYLNNKSCYVAYIRDTEGNRIGLYARN
jgi:predicted enzyme related to lactoylglutathione lyase